MIRFQMKASVVISVFGFSAEKSENASSVCVFIRKRIHEIGALGFCEGFCPPCLQPSSFAIPS